MAGPATVLDVLRDSGVAFRPTWGSEAATGYPLAGAPGVYVTGAGQLVGPYSAFDAFRAANPDYAGWEAHHVVERQLLDQLGVAHRFTDYADNLCVLLPSGGHRGRRNKFFRAVGKAERLEVPTCVEVLDAYCKAYHLLGDYCGGGERAIARELMRLVNSTSGTPGCRPRTRGRSTGSGCSSGRCGPS